MLNIIHFVYRHLHCKHLQRLDTELEDYFLNHVKIQEDSMSEARRVYDCVKLGVEEYLHQYHAVSFPTGRFIDSGSFADGIKVVAPNEFDVLVPIILPDMSHYFDRQTPLPDVAAFKVKDNVSVSDSRNKWIANIVKVTEYHDEALITEE